MKILWNLALLFMVGLFNAQAQLHVNVYASEQEMMDALLKADQSFSVSNVTFTGAKAAFGTFENNNTVLPISRGVLLSTGFAEKADGPNSSQGFTGSNRTPGDQDIHFIADFKTYDACALEFEFTTTNDLMLFEYVFASDEYPEYVGSAFNDLFAFILTDIATGEAQNLAVIPNTTQPITVNNINHRSHSDFYIENISSVRGNKLPIEYDGLTQELIAYAAVTPGKTYHLKIVIADVGDDAYDSGVFLKGASFQSMPSEAFYSERENYFITFNGEKTAISKTGANNLTVEEPHSNKQVSDGVSTTQEVFMSPDSIVIYFDLDNTHPQKNSLQQAADLLEQITLNSYQFEIIGHTDAQASLAYNQNLSKKRALGIQEWLQTNYHIKASASWVAYTQPVTNSLSQEAYARNRRVVIYMIPN